MNITIFYPQILSTGKNYETLENITKFEEKSYGISFYYENLYVFFPYTHISSFSLSEVDENDT